MRMTLIVVSLAVVGTLGLAVLLTSALSHVNSTPAAAASEDGTRTTVASVNGRTAEFSIDGMYCSL